MFSFRTTPIEHQEDTVFKGGRIGLLCNHTAWHPEWGEYIFEYFAKKFNLIRIFTPEHGLFAELQDQVKIDDTEVYKNLGLINNITGKEVEIISLYGNSEESLAASKSKLQDLDALVIELQDVGVRYYTYSNTIFNIFKTLKNNSIDLPVYLIDRINPSGREVEGTMLRAGYRSFIGIEGIVHRHGLTIGELAYYLYDELHAKFPLHIISWKASEISKNFLPWSISPSPNFPGLFTSHFYSGQCLWEGTNISEGRGTTRPFEQFGAPFMSELATYNKIHKYNNWNSPQNPLYDEGIFLRWIKFIPTFHKYKDECCYGFFLHPNPGTQYNALIHNLKIMRFCKENLPEFEFRKGKYEAGNDRMAIELLLGDKELIDFVQGNGSIEDLKEHIKIEEQKWIKKAKKILLYPEEQLYRIK